MGSKDSGRWSKAEMVGDVVMPGEGPIVGKTVGTALGSAVGSMTGAVTLGTPVGESDGWAVAEGVALPVTLGVSVIVADALAVSVGLALGETETGAVAVTVWRASVGCGVGNSCWVVAAMLRPRPSVAARARSEPRPNT